MGIRSLRLNLLLGMLLPLGALFAINVAAVYRHANEMADIVANRTLLASARSIAEAVRDGNGGVEVVIPPAALGMFESEYRDLVYYRITNARGDLLAGYEALPGPPRRIGDFEHVFYDARFRGEAVRIVALTQLVPLPHRMESATVLVGATMRARDAMVSELSLESAQRQGILVLIASALAWFTLRRVLAPLLRLGKEVAARRPDDFERLSVTSIHDELRPLVSALNEHMGRLGDQLNAQRRFTANAAHQLRTPLTLLHTQVQYALNKSTPQDQTDVVRAIAATSEQMTRLIAQLMTLSRADSDQRLHHGPVDLTSLTRRFLEEYAPSALAHGIDLAFEDNTVRPAIVHGDPALLREVLVNLVDNAVRYTTSGGSVTVTLAHDASGCLLLVRDDGPGIPATERELVFERFYRILGNEAEGSGLGLAIVKDIVNGHNGTIVLRDPPEGPGLVVEVRFPLRVRESGDLSPGRRRDGRTAADGTIASTIVAANTPEQVI
jgi:two-component system, OmpR family, sensor histidine kinase TctE